MNTLPWHQRVFLKSVRGLAKVTGFYHIDFDVELMRQHGVYGMLSNGLRMQRIFDRIEQHFGVEKAHLLAAFASFFNGCEYCAWGHLFAVNLRYFKRTGKLYPLDERDVTALMRLPDADALRTIGERLGVDFADSFALLQRQHALRAEPTTGSEEDTFLSQTLQLFEWVNECSIMSPAPAPPLDKTARDTALLEAYAKARESTRGAAAP
jgi:hypothetical protein